MLVRFSSADDDAVHVPKDADFIGIRAALDGCTVTAVALKISVARSLNRSTWSARFVSVTIGHLNFGGTLYFGVRSAVLSGWIGFGDYSVLSVCLFFLLSRRLYVIFRRSLLAPRKDLDDACTRKKSVIKRR